MAKTRILVAPGVGDMYWVLVKLQSFMRRNGITDPEITVASYEDPLGIHLRSKPYMEMFDWLKIGDPSWVSNAPGLDELWDEAYNRSGRTIFSDVMGFDYFISYNGRINGGGWIEDDDLECNWYPSMNTMAISQIRQHADRFKGEYGRYAVMSWPTYGTYQFHVADFGIDKIIESLNIFSGETGLIPIVCGAEWEHTLSHQVKDIVVGVNGAIDLIGKTTLSEMIGLFSSAEMVLGYHMGITQMGVALGRKAVLIWDDMFPVSTSFACVPPPTRRTNYLPLRSNGLTVFEYVSAMRSVYSGNLDPRRVTDSSGTEFTVPCSLTSERIRGLACRAPSGEEILGKALVPNDVCMTSYEAYRWYWALGAATAPRKILEMGSRYGYSLIAMAKGAIWAGAKPELVSIDAEADGVECNAIAAEGVRNELPPETRLTQFRINTADVDGIMERLKSQAYTGSAPASSSSAGFDLIHVDADHTESGIFRELSIAENLVTQSAVILVDDCDAVHINNAMEKFAEHHRAKTFRCPTQHSLVAVDLHGTWTPDPFLLKKSPHRAEERNDVRPIATKSWIPAPVKI